VGAGQLLNDIEAISFDADGTLWDLQKVMRHALGFALEELTKARPSTEGHLTIDQMIEIREEIASTLKGKVPRLEDVRLAAFAETISRLGQADDQLAQHLNDTYLEHRFEDIELFDDVVETLNVLENNYVLGIVSNGNSYPEKCGLDGRFEFVVFAQDHGVDKPDPLLFEVAIAEAACPRKSFLHVGDSLGDDITGARRAGVWSAWLNRSAVSNNTAIQPDCEIKSLLELPELLQYGASRSRLIYRAT
jgi:HAD superfamily hydrolase (TIGR01549 family)